MAKSVIDIVINLIKQGGADKQTVDGLIAVKKSMNDALTVGASFAAIYYGVDKVLENTVGVLVAYADEVRRVQNATGASAEDSSKLIQILDDQKISYEQLEKAISKSGKAYDFSIAGIAKMSDEYLKLGNEQDKAAFMQERFGKQWISFVPIMKQGGDAIRSAADAVQQNLILTQQAVDAARSYEISMDNLNDSVDGVKVSLGQGLIPITTQFVDGVQVAIRAVQIQSETHVSTKEAFAQATEEIARGKLALMDHTAAVSQNTESEKANAEAEKAAAQAIRETTAAHQSMLGLIGSIANETKNYSEKQADLNAKMAENRAEAETLYPWQTEQLAQLDQKYAEMGATYEANAAAHNAAMGKIQYDLLVTKLSVDGITDAEFNMIQQAGLMFGVFDQSSVTAAQSMNAVAAAVDAGKLRVQDMQAALQMLSGGKYQVEVILNTLSNIAQGQQAMSGRGSMMAAPGYNPSRGYDKGGISTGPDSGHMELLHGTEAVIPLQNGSVPVQLQGGVSGGGSMNVNVQLTIASPVTILDQQTAQKTLMPFIIQGVREARARGAL